MTRSTAALLVCAVLGCTADSTRDSSSVTTSDVDGVVHVRVASLAPKDVPLWSTHMTFSTAAPDTRLELYQVTAARFLRDGTLAVANSGTGEIIAFDSTGNETRRMGRKGEGPGEFAWISHLDADSSGNLIAYDPRQGRLTRFAADGIVLDTRPLSPPNRVVDLQPLAILRDGRLAAVYGAMRNFAMSGERRDTTPLMLFSADGARADTIAMWPATEWAFMSGGGGAMRAEVGFGRKAAWAGRNGRFAIGANDSVDVAVYDGASQPSMRISGPPAPAVEPAVVDRWRDDLLADWSTMPAEMQTAIADLPHRETYPGFESLVIAADGSIWIGSFVRPGENERQWLVLGPDGDAQGRATLPASAEILDIAGDRIALLSRDDLDEEYVHVLRIEREQP
jgi:hypothetical protein